MEQAGEGSAFPGLTEGRADSQERGACPCAEGSAARGGAGADGRGPEVRASRPAASLPAGRTDRCAMFYTHSLNEGHRFCSNSREKLPGSLPPIPFKKKLMSKVRRVLAGLPWSRRVGESTNGCVCLSVSPSLPFSLPPSIKIMGKYPGVGINQRNVRRMHCAAAPLALPHPRPRSAEERPGASECPRASRVPTTQLALHSVSPHGALGLRPGQFLVWGRALCTALPHPDPVCLLGTVIE